MTPETGFFLKKARKQLDEAEAILAIDLFEVAGRSAYLAAFHAGQAFISEKTGRSVKTHEGVHGELYRLTATVLGFDPKLRVFLSQNCDLKNIADYDTGPEATVSPERARLAVLQAAAFLSYFETILAAPSASDDKPS